MFNFETCAASAKAGNLQNWVLSYLATGYWANLGLRDGLHAYLGSLAERCTGGKARENNLCMSKNMATAAKLDKRPHMGKRR